MSGSRCVSVSLLAVLSLLVCRSTMAQIVVGQVLPKADFVYNGDAGTTFIDRSTPAAASGDLTVANVGFALFGSSCDATYKIRFFRPSPSLYPQMAMLAERGPFTTATDGLQTVTLSPAVTVQRGDLIGVLLTNTGCGIAGQYSDDNQATIVVSGDYAGGPLSTGADYNTRRRASIRASSTLPVLAGIVPAVGSLSGAFGAQFRTSFQTTNQSAASLSGVTFYFHPQGQVGTLSDPSATLTLAGRATDTTDLLSAMHVTGLGSLDVYTTAWVPLVTTRVYNDTGSGTNGFYEPMIPLSAALHSAEYSDIVFPSDLTSYRMNIGVRSVGATSLFVAIFDANGNQTGTIERTYPQNYFEQRSLQDFIGTTPATAAGSMYFQVTGGDLIVYASTTDNRTNDSAIAIAQKR